MKGPAVCTAAVLSLAPLPNEPGAQRTQRIQSFYRSLCRTESDYLILDGGLAESSRLNQGCLIGLHPRQRLVLTQEALCWHPPSSLSLGVQSIELASAEDLWRLLREASETLMDWQKIAENAVLPFYGGWSGFFGYEFARWAEPALFQAFTMQQKTGFPALHLTEYQDWIWIDRLSGEAWLLCGEQERVTLYQAQWQQALACSVGAFAMPAPSLLPHHQNVPSKAWKASLDQPAFTSAVEKIQAAIRSGQLYQANLSIQLSKPLTLQPLACWERLTAFNPSPFSGVYHTAEGVILSNSPERLISVSCEGVLETRPIAGTRGRGQNKKEEQAIAATLLASEKEIAEHLMLVDLQRNDLGRVSQAGSVRVDELLGLERYSHVTHLVSNVTGLLKEGADVWEVLRALFPGGTITGCPKIRCIQLLSELEPCARGPYTGSLGYLNPRNNTLDLNILIRSLYLLPEETLAHEDIQQEMQEKTRDNLPVFRYNATVQVGAGIVADSVAAHEYRECYRKAAALLGVLEEYERNPAPRNCYPD